MLNNNHKENIEKPFVLFVQKENEFNVPVGSLLRVQKSNNFSDGEIVFCTSDEFNLGHFGIIRGANVEVHGYVLNTSECDVHIIIEGENNPNINNEYENVR